MPRTWSLRHGRADPSFIVDPVEVIPGRLEVDLFSQRTVPDLTTATLQLDGTTRNEDRRHGHVEDSESVAPLNRRCLSLQRIAFQESHTTSTRTLYSCFRAVDRQYDPCDYVQHGIRGATDLESSTWPCRFQFHRGSCGIDSRSIGNGPVLPENSPALDHGHSSTRRHNPRRIGFK